MNYAVDVIVIGGGPAGIATALALARCGRHVTVVERTCYDNPRIGETLPPRARPLLDALGLAAALQDDGHLPAPGIVVAWGASRAHCNDFIVNPYGNGWHLDRQRFDRMLATQARRCGVTVREQTTVAACETDGDGWRVALNDANAPSAVTCRFLVDATGRRASPMKHRNRRMVHDKLIGIAAFMPRATGADRRTLIESAAGGWWYSALLPDQRQVAVYMTDADTLSGGRHDLGCFLRRQVREAPLTQARCGAFAGAVSVAPFAAMTYQHARVYGSNWLLAGDAATTWDPLSGQGICKALESGLRAGRAIDSVLDGNFRGVEDYAQWTQVQFADYLKQRAHYYRAEQRWPDAPFWRRRHLAI